MTIFHDILILLAVAGIAWWRGVKHEIRIENLEREVATLKPKNSDIFGDSDD